jgi:hypothetical protein
MVRLELRQSSYTRCSADARLLIGQRSHDFKTSLLCYVHGIASFCWNAESSGEEMALPLGGRAIASEAFREYPFATSAIYTAPVQLGPANPLYSTATGYHATILGFPRMIWINGAARTRPKCSLHSLKRWQKAGGGAL